MATTEGASPTSRTTGAEPPQRYSARLATEIEAKWQNRWASGGTFETPNPFGPLGDPQRCAGREKFYLLDMFPYPSDATLHVGHPLGYIATDVFGRYQRMMGRNVLHAMGYDAFGLPAEQYALQTGRHPRETTGANIDRMRLQLRRLGLAHDERRSVVTTDERFYGFTQWMFLQMFESFYDADADRARPIDTLVEELETGARRLPDGHSWATVGALDRRRIVDGHRLAYLEHAPVNWCPGLGTVLSDEEVTSEGRSERGNFPVFRRDLRQWKLRITAYADRLLRDIETVDWPEPIKAMQRHWIGRSEGTLIEPDGSDRRYRLRDWLFSRQRYWGEPFPIVYDEHDLPVALPADLLPLALPEMTDFSPSVFDPEDGGSDPVPPLARATDWVEVVLDLGEGPKTYRRECNTMPQWAGSCWYYLRYLDPTNAERFCDAEVERYWMGPRDQADPGGVDLYVGGVEHAVLHLLYARFWHKVLHDLGLVSSREPFRRLFNQGYVQAAAYSDAPGSYVPAAEVVEVGGLFYWRGSSVTRRYGKMGKSLKNAITPDELAAEYGADTLRVYEMSMAPVDASRPWETRAVAGAHRFLQRLWRALVDESTGEARVGDLAADDATRRLLHRTIVAVGGDYGEMRFNTAAAKLIELTNHLTRLAATSPVPREVAEPLVLMLAPLAPHVAEELWERLGHGATLAYEAFPRADPGLLDEPHVTCVIQVSGKVRDRIQVPSGASGDELRLLALESRAVLTALGGRPVARTVVVPPRLVNVVPAEGGQPRAAAPREGR